MRTILIVKLGSTLPWVSRKHGDFEDWIKSGLGLSSNGTRVVEVCQGDDLPDPQQLSGVVLTGSHAMVTDREDWSERTAAWIPRVVRAEVPLLGICYGHQLLARAMGGTVGQNPLGSQFGTVEVRLQEPASLDSLFGGFSSILRAHTCHVQSVLALPPGAKLLASSDRDPHQAFSLGPVAWGVQFHPEFKAEIVGSYVKECSDMLRTEGLDPDSLLHTITDTPDSEALLRRFGEIITDRP